MWPPLPRLYRLAARSRLCDALSEIGAGDKPGPFMPDPKTPIGAICQVIARHDVAVVHPAPAWLIPMLWWPLQRAGNAAGDPWTGPPLHIDHGGFTLPALRQVAAPAEIRHIGNTRPAGRTAGEGVTIATALRSSLLAVPGAVGKLPGPHHHYLRTPLGEALLALLDAQRVIEVARFRQVQPFARRVVPVSKTLVPAPALMWLAGKKALPGGGALMRWYSALVAGHWYRLVVARLLEQLVAGDLIAQVGGDRVPVTFWQSTMTIDLDRGSLTTSFGVPLYRDLVVYHRNLAPRARLLDVDRGLSRKPGGGTPKGRRPANWRWGWGSLPQAARAGRGRAGQG